MKKNTLLFFFFLFSTIVNINLFAQNSDIGQDSKSGVTANYGITQEESNWLNSKINTPDIEIPQELLNQLEQARINNDVDEANRINNIINSQYRTGVRIINTNTNNSIDLPQPITENLFPTQNDWLPGDVLVAADTGGGNQYPRTLDIKLGDDGNLYLASIVSTSTQRRINVYKSSDGGGSWVYKGGIYFGSLTSYFQSLSMLVESRSPSIEDSVRVIVYYTSSSNTANDNASLSYFQFKPNPTNHEYVLGGIDTPSSGREFNYVSAISDGQYYTGLTYFGCVVGEYSNNADTSISYRVFRTTNWGSTHSSVTLDIYATTWNDYYPMAQFKASASGIDSIYIVSERVFPSTTQSQVRITIAPWTLSTTFKTNFLTNVSSTYYKKPVLAIKQSPRIEDKRMVITCTKDGQAKYHYSTNSGDSWSTDLFLDNRSTPSVNTTYTYVTSDSTGSSEDFCAMFSERNGGGINDSINVRRGAPGVGLGTIFYQQNSQGITSTHPAVTTIYREGGSLKSAFAYWGNGPNGIYFDAEHLLTNVSDLPGTVDKYELAQNYPNPFNPSTVIRFSLPEQANVTLKIFNSIGQEVATLVNGEMSAGNHQVDFNASTLSSGIYFYQIGTANFTATKKMILIK